MKKSTPRAWMTCWQLSFMVILMLIQTADGQWITKSINLSSGWNAVYLDMTPTPSDCDTVFGSNARILSVRRWSPPAVESVQYDSTTGSTLPANGSWLTWFPTNHADRALISMVEVAGSAAYLVEVSDGGQINLNLQGRPLLQSFEWIPGTHHFVGLPVFSSTLNFANFFAASGGNIQTDYRVGGELYSVLPSGAHQRIFTPTTTLINPMAAYWIKAQQYSTYAGPIQVKLDNSIGWMDFGRRLAPQYVEIKNTTGASRGVKIAQLASATPPAGTAPLAGLVPLKFVVISGASEAAGRVWQTFTSPWSTQLVAGGSVRLAFIPDALSLTHANTNAAFQSVLEVTDDVGNAGMVRQKFGVRVLARSGTATESRGLWVGEVTVTDVGRLEMPGVFGIPQTPRPAARPFTFRLLAHVDNGGTARLLQRVFVGTRPDTANGGVVTEILANEGRVSLFQSQHPDAKVFRYSSANFPFMSPVILANGAFGVPNQAVLGEVNVNRDDPVNPFRHSFAPLHDNKERRAETDVPYVDDVEVFSVKRSIEMVFQGPDQVNPEPRWGESACGGVYREKIYGLGGPIDASNRVVTVEGRFTLKKASPVGTLLQ